MGVSTPTCIQNKVGKMFELMNEIQDTYDELKGAVNKLAADGREKAKTEQEYRIALKQESLRLKDSGMSVTLIDKVVYGVQEVAEKRFNRDVAQTMYENTLERINMLKLRVRILDEQISREWHSGGEK